MSPHQAMQTAQALHTLSGFSFPYNVNLASAAPFVDPSGFQLLYSCTPVTTSTNTAGTGTIQLSAGSHLGGGSVSILNHGDCTTTTMTHCAKNMTSDRITATHHGMCHASDHRDIPHQRSTLSLNSNSSDSSSVGSRTPEVVTPASSPLSSVTTVSGTLRLTGSSMDSFCHLPYPSSPVECASLAAVSSTPFSKTALGGGGVAAISEAPSIMQATIPRREACRLPKPFTIEAILGLESSRCVDAALNMIANVERTFDYKRRNSNTNIINNTNTISNNNHTNKGVHCNRASNHIVSGNVGNIHRRLTTPTGKDCRKFFKSTKMNNAQSSEKPSKSKRVRTIFTPEQLERLENEFERQQYMVGPERLYLAASLNLTEAQVKVWFQNRRIKWRKQHLEMQHARLAKIRDEDGTKDCYHEEFAEETSDEEIQ